MKNPSMQVQYDSSDTPIISTKNQGFHDRLLLVIRCLACWKTVEGEPFLSQDTTRDSAISLELPVKQPYEHILHSPEKHPSHSLEHHLPLDMHIMSVCK